MDDPNDNAVRKYCLHPSIKRIKQNFSRSRIFECTPFSVVDVNDQFKRLVSKKATPLESIAGTILKVLNRKILKMSFYFT